MLLRVLLGFVLVGASQQLVSAQVDFKAKVPAESTETLEFKAVSKHSMKSPLFSVTGETTATTQFRFAFGAHNATEGFTPVEITVAKLKLDGEFPAPPAGEKVHVVFDSALPNAKPANEFFEPLFAQQRRMLDTKLACKVGDDGKVYRANDAQGEVTPEQEQSLGYFNWRMGAMLQQGLRPGDTWDSHQRRVLGAGQVMELDKHFEYVGLDTSEATKKSGKKLHKFKVTTKNPKVTLVEPPGVKYKTQEMSIKGEVGEMLFNEALGRTEAATESFQVVGKLVMAIGEQELVAEIEMDMDSTTRFVE